MKNILEEVVEQRKAAVQQLKSIVPMQAWEMMPLYQRQCISLQQNLLDANGTGIIAEFKRASPSKGIINNDADIFDVVSGYELHGAAAASILTEPVYFKGNNDDIINIRASITIPILRKDFIFEEYQIAEAKAIGADVILLIAASLTPAEVKRLATFAIGIGLEVLLEIHTEEELEHICDATTIVGINNRDLKTFTVDINRSIELGKKIPADKIKIAESGINNIETICTFKNAGFKGFLIGENFMKQPDPTIAFAEFVQQLKAKDK
ncbi:indole-3-glycerol phosphate synthase TrpC [Ferruginibacter profundus]